jgi:hypothetical protein
MSDDDLRIAEQWANLSTLPANMSFIWAGKRLLAERAEVERLEAENRTYWTQALEGAPPEITQNYVEHLRSEVARLKEVCKWNAGRTDAELDRDAALADLATERKISEWLAMRYVFTMVNVYGNMIPADEVLAEAREAVRSEVARLRGDAE